MFDPNLMAPVDVGGKIAAGFQQGQQTAEQNMAKAAMAALVQDPTNQRALQALARVDPASAQQFQQQHLESVRQQLAVHQDNILKGAEIIRQVQPKDQQSYSHALMIAQQAGVDVSQVPQEYNPQYVDGVVKLADALKPQNTNSDQVVVTPQPGAPALIYNKQTGETRMLVAPNDGSHQPGTPALAEPPPAAIARLRTNPHEAAQFDEVFGPGASQKALGGQTAPAPSGTFP